ncbi:indole-3-glycerol phosphate synthase TrpC [Wenzhouxiangella sp. AB-CW3]|uniref:indole-3-glycerol phosphate synthase TrpC n=1 Tax=Wenzhouxiangella sp. AB-CW3 TaxID=2771012 RepID=UPI00168AF78F|nr:indole-3-glycerol phosphate synthase TrpC [Wenzhouxiangella sp. AB-CW3]QOC21835.1 indole-3-glycerol phosphate synthase TrpC [Wenzhouxiangella sp. AB-CW3]
MSADILKTILEAKRDEIERRRADRTLEELKAIVGDMPPCRDFAGELKTRAAATKDAVIAEVKRASPSAGIIRKDFDPEAIAKSYEAGGATCLSVLTDEGFFGGQTAFLVEARKACRLPVLRKDFIIDPWQVIETRAIGADALLLIVAALNDDQLAELSELGKELGLAVLVEVHDEQEMERALKVPGDLVGINNRDLHRFVTDLETTLRLAPMVPKDRLVVSESGIHTPEDIKRLQDGGIGAFLIGEAFMREEEPGEALGRLIAG